MTPEEQERVINDEHLRLLALFHYISGGIMLSFSVMFASMMMLMAIMFSSMPLHPTSGNSTPHPSDAPPTIVFVFFGMFLLVGAVLGIVEIASGRCMSQRRKRPFSLIVAVPRILMFPYGTILSIFTLLVLERKSVKELYRASSGS